MGLPVLQHPTFELTIPSTNEKIRYRPYLVKEEKILLLAQQSGEPQDIIEAVSQIISNCVNNYDTTSITSFDTEYIFLKLRANSVSDLATINVYDDETDQYVEVEVDLNDVQCPIIDQSNIIQLSEGVSITLRYTKYTDLLKINPDDDFETSTDYLAMCIDKVLNGDEVLELKDFSKEEQETFINSFSADSFKNIKKYFDTMPKVTMEIEYKVKVNNRNKTKKKKLEGIADFF